MTKKGEINMHCFREWAHFIKLCETCLPRRHHCFLAVTHQTITEVAFILKSHLHRLSEVVDFRATLYHELGSTSSLQYSPTDTQAGTKAINLPNNHKEFPPEKNSQSLYTQQHVLLLDVHFMNTNGGRPDRSRLKHLMRCVGVCSVSDSVIY
ncbi:hypothetical protein INR49_017179 [Caranx melampygus]|nr:hypothetical protein INR49_017179 [Caranx melampygus]